MEHFALIPSDQTQAIEKLKKKREKKSDYNIYKGILSAKDQQPIIVFFTIQEVCLTDLV